MIEFIPLDKITDKQDEDEPNFIPTIKNFSKTENPRRYNAFVREIKEWGNDNEYK